MIAFGIVIRVHLQATDYQYLQASLLLRDLIENVKFKGFGPKDSALVTLGPRNPSFFVCLFWQGVNPSF